MTLAFSWASNTNYSAGPDTGTPTKVDPSSAANGFIPGFIAAPQHINHLFSAVGAELAKAVDGIGGGTYTLTNALQFGGQAVRFAGVVELLASGELNIKASSELNIEANAALTIEASGSLDVDGNLNIQSGGNLNVSGNADIHLLSNADLDVGDGARLTVAATGIAQMATADRLTIDAASFTARLGMTPVMVESGWVADNDGKWVWTVAQGRRGLFALPLHVGDTLLTVIARITGDHTGSSGHGGGAPTELPFVEVVRKDQDGTTLVIATGVDPGGAPYDTAHDITASFGPGVTVLPGYTYYARVVSEGSVGTPGVNSSSALLSMRYTGFARSFRGSEESHQ